MALFVIGDLHLSIEGNKSMEKFRGWSGYVEKLTENWNSMVKPEDTVILAGDSSWGMSLSESLPDFRFIHALPGTKYLLKGNHDYWWTTKSKMDRFFAENELTSLHILHNNAVRVGDITVCGTRGWMLEDGKPADKKVTVREAMRLEASIKEADLLGGEKIAVLHYPPIFALDESTEILEIIKKHGIRRCYYGHLHSSACAFAFNSEKYGTHFQLISGDFVKFKPLLVE
ncbi:MAG: serine/threonine protein phosphatase [Ruminococcaceae bacterium]|nr:serine/threonine protein phosphatase [Oscillospiraceae bacterium]